MLCSRINNSVKRAIDTLLAGLQRVQQLTVHDRDILDIMTSVAYVGNGTIGDSNKQLVP